MKAHLMSVLVATIAALSIATGALAERNCAQALQGKSYLCQVQREFAIPVLGCLRFYSSPSGLQLSAGIGLPNGPGAVLGQFDCACGATGSSRKPKYEASRSFYCHGPGLDGDYVFTGIPTTSGNRIFRGEYFVATSPAVFDCTLRTEPCP